MNNAQQPYSESEFAFEMKGVSRSYQHFQYGEVSLAMPTGYIMGLIGPNGAGKSTTIRMLMNLIGRDSGEVNVLGNRCPEQQVNAKWKIGFVSEDMGLYSSQTLAWHMAFLSKIYPSWDQRYADHLVQRFKLVAEQKINASIMEVLTDESRSILFSSHNTQDVEQLSDQITFINHGKIVCTDDKESYLENWRRIRVNISSGSTLPSIEHAIQIKNSGSLNVITTNHFNESQLTVLRNGGAEIQAVERMTLEEIFVAQCANPLQRSAETAIKQGIAA